MARVTDFVTVARAGEIQPGSLLLVDLGGRRIAIVNADGAFYAVDGRCTHQNVTMIDAPIVGCSIICSFHGSRFNLKTGVVEDSPAEIPLRTYSVIIDNDTIKLAYPET